MRAALLVAMVVSTAAAADPFDTALSKDGMLGIKLDLALWGKAHGTSNGQDFSTGLNHALAVTGFYDYKLTPKLWVGAQPRYVFSVHPDGAFGDGKEVDLHARVTYGNASRWLRWHLIGTAGYSIITGVFGDRETTSGLSWSLGAGVGAPFFKVMTTFFEFSYQRGYEDNGAADWFWLGFGASVPL